MQAKEIAKELKINTDRIKYFRKKEVFCPEKPGDAKENTNYTEKDLEILKKIVVLNKAGISCGDIKKVQDGKKPLEQILQERIDKMLEDTEKLKASISLSRELLKDNVEYNTLVAEEYLGIINCKELEGEEFINPDEYYEEQVVSLVQEITCPHCGAVQKIDLEDYLLGQSSSERENGMGPDMVYEFDTEDNYECENCEAHIRVSGWIREYPIGAYDSDDITIE